MFLGLKTGMKEPRKGHLSSETQRPVVAGGAGSSAHSVCSEGNEHQLTLSVLEGTSIRSPQLKGSVTTLSQKYLATISNGKRRGGALLILRLKSWIFQPTCFSTLCCTATHAATKSQETFSREVIPRNKQSPASVSELPKSVSFWNSECVLPSSHSHRKGFQLAYRCLIY